VSGHPSAAGRAQDRESTSAKDRRSTTEPTPPTERSLVLQYEMRGNQKTDNYDEQPKSSAVIIHCPHPLWQWSLSQHDSLSLLYGPDTPR